MALSRIKRLIDQNRYDYTGKIRDRIEEGEFTEDDLATCILTATKIYKKERDELSQSVDGMKYVIVGKDTQGAAFYTAGKIRKDYSGKYYFFLTAHEAH